MAKLPYGIHKDPYEPRVYSGSDGLRKWKIRKTNSSFGNWAAHIANPQSYQQQSRTIFALTLEEMAHKLAYVA